MADGAGKLELHQLSGSRAKPGDSMVFDGRVWRPGVGAVPVLFVSTEADGPPTDGSVFWYVTDAVC